jgi:hypothetical protein
MLIKKITTGFVVQTFDTKTDQWVKQEFIAGDSEFEGPSGNAIDPINDIYLPFDMKQPGQDPGEKKSRKRA